MSADPVRLVPIRLDFEVDGVKVRDTFTWNLNGNYPHLPQQTFD